MKTIKDDAIRLEKELEALEHDMKEIFASTPSKSMTEKCEMWSIMTGTNSMWVYQWYKGIKEASWKQVLKMAKAFK